METPTDIALQNLGQNEVKYCHVLNEDNVTIYITRVTLEGDVQKEENIFQFSSVEDLKKAIKMVSENWYFFTECKEKWTETRNLISELNGRLLELEEKLQNEAVEDARIAMMSDSPDDADKDKLDRDRMGKWLDEAEKSNVSNNAGLTQHSHYTASLNEGVFNMTNNVDDFKIESIYEMMRAKGTKVKISRDSKKILVNLSSQEDIKNVYAFIKYYSMSINHGDVMPILQQLAKQLQEINNNNNTASISTNVWLEDMSTNKNNNVSEVSNTNTNHMQSLSMT